VQSNDNEEQNNNNNNNNNNAETTIERRLPLHYACRGRAPLDVAEYLLEIEPAAISTRGLDGMLPLHEACSSDENDGRDLPPLSLPLIQFLVNKYPDALLAPSSTQLLPLHYASCAKNVPLSVIEYLVKENPTAVKVSSYQGLLPLHLAAYFCESAQVFLFLYEAYPSAIGMKDACGCTCLHVACAALASPDLIMNIISWHPESLRIEDGFGRLPLHIACLTDAPVNVIKYMAESFPESLVMKDSEEEGDLPLDMVASRAHHASEDVIECLVLNGMPPLHFACYYKASIQTLRFLNEKYPAMITAVFGKDQFRPLHYACLSSNSSERLLEIVDFLLEQDPDAMHARSTTTGELPLHVACRGQAGIPLEVIERLFEQSPAAIKCVDNDGLSPLDVACGHDAELDIIFFLVMKDPAQLRRFKK
jgi:ankyrin repeat protein